MEPAYCADDAETIRRATELIQNAQARYKTDPARARHGLELAERLLDEHLLLKYHITRSHMDDPYSPLFDEIMAGWKILERKVVTQLGSLPYEDPAEAIDYSLRHDIPFLPELPERGESMLEYIKNPGRLSCLDEFKKHAFETVKIQCIGPATLVLSGYSEDEAVARIYEHISAIMNGLRAQEILFFLDEPALGHAGFDYKALWKPIFESFKDFNIVSGVHTCGSMDWDALFDSDIDIISFDASKYGDNIMKYSGYRSGKRIAWGIADGGDVKDFQRGDLLTLPCGMNPHLYRLEDCEKNLEMLLQVSRSIHP